MSTINVLGVPSSAGSYAPGQELAPAALREAGLLRALADAGHDVRDHGDLTHQTWKPDRSRRRAQNLGEVVLSVDELAQACAAHLGGDERLLVLGGNCTIALGTCAGLRHAGAEPGLVYVDRHFDLSTPDSTAEGALDWMGMAHALDVEGAVPELLNVLGARPLLHPSRLSYLGVDVDGAAEWEQRCASRLDLPVVPLDALAQNPARAASQALQAIAPGPLVVHVDVDVLDFIDAPIAENVNGRNTGPTIEQLEDAIAVLWAHLSCRGLSIGELNPVHAAADTDAMPRFVAAVVRALTP